MVNTGKISKIYKNNPKISKLDSTKYLFSIIVNIPPKVKKNILLEL